MKQYNKSFLPKAAAHLKTRLAEAVKKEVLEKGYSISKENGEIEAETYRLKNSFLLVKYLEDGQIDAALLSSGLTNTEASGLSKILQMPNISSNLFK